VRAHVGLYKARAAHPDHLRDGIFEVLRVADILDQRASRRRLAVDGAHDDHAVLRELRAVREGAGRTHVRYNRVAEVRGRTRMMPDQFEAGGAVGENHDLTGEREEWNVGVRTETAFAGQRHLGVGRVCERRCDLGARRIELRAGPLDVPAKGAEAVGIDDLAHPDPPAQRALKQWSDHPLLAVHRREHRRLLPVGSGRAGHR